ncbi:MAG: MaoC family dehydratase [Acidimicrobiia bacterium]|nr:MaoC family dehydratase [Acidimicrobiia bacterium]
MSTRSRTLTITEDLVRAYSRRGNYHSDASEAARLGLPGLVAQGTQAMGPAYGLLLDEWGEAFLAEGEIDVRFVGIVLAGQTVAAEVELSAEAPGEASIEVVNTDSGRTAVVGTASVRRRPASRGRS